MRAKTASGQTVTRLILPDSGRKSTRGRAERTFAGEKVRNDRAICTTSLSDVVLCVTVPKTMVDPYSIDSFTTAVTGLTVLLTKKVGNNGFPVTI